MLLWRILTTFSLSGKYLRILPTFLPQWQILFFCVRIFQSYKFRVVFPTVANTSEFLPLQRILPCNISLCGEYSFLLADRRYAVTTVFPSLANTLLRNTYDFLPLWRIHTCICICGSCLCGEYTTWKNGMLEKFLLWQLLRKTSILHNPVTPLPTFFLSSHLSFD